MLKNSNKYNVPEELPKTGLLLHPNEDDEPIIGVWIMPDNESKNICRYKSIHKAKARIHTFLAWQEDPGTPMGLAITKKYLKPDSTNCLPFVNWLQELFKTS